MEILISKKYCIITPMSSKLDIHATMRLEEEIKKHSGLIIGINMDYVTDCSIEFLDAARKFKASFFNINSDIFSLLNIMNLDKTTALYTTEDDFKTRRRRLINRRFNIV